LFIFLFIQFIFLLLRWPLSLILHILQVICFSVLFNNTHLHYLWMKFNTKLPFMRPSDSQIIFCFILGSERPPKLDAFLWPAYEN
jgi:hypothetical protein